MYKNKTNSATLLLKTINIDILSLRTTGRNRNGVLYTNTKKERERERRKNKRNGFVVFAHFLGEIFVGGEYVQCLNVNKL
jgi:hypothetical protein